MATVSSRFNIAGTYGNLVIYKVGSKLYARNKSSLDRKRFFKDPAFTRSREKSEAFGVAARFAKTLYAAFPKEIKQPGLFGKLTGIVHKGLLAGHTMEAIFKEIRSQFGIELLPTQNKNTSITTTSSKNVGGDYLSQWIVTTKGKLQAHNSSFKPHAQLHNYKDLKLQLWDG